ncbi:MAG: hypothetical protein LBD73_04200 [Deferribacteraceae bacterium]|nr:hypothetical protein [Deferribacteraceae bacterium]
MTLCAFAAFSGKSAVLENLRSQSVSSREIFEESVIFGGNKNHQETDNADTQLRANMRGTLCYL